jgi:hypothetical protein
MVIGQKDLGQHCHLFSLQTHQFCHSFEFGLIQNPAKSALWRNCRFLTVTSGCRITKRTKHRGANVGIKLACASKQRKIVRIKASLWRNGG